MIKQVETSPLKKKSIRNIEIMPPRMRHKMAIVCNRHLHQTKHFAISCLENIQKVNRLIQALNIYPFPAQSQLAARELIEKVKTHKQHKQIPHL